MLSSQSSLRQPHYGSASDSRRSGWDCQQTVTPWFGWCSILTGGINCDCTRKDTMPNQRAAPVFLNLFRIHFPVGAVTSIAHRISGVLMFLSLPLLIYLLDISLQGPAGFDRALGYLLSG
ncbi:MAG: succinate dehydrogenase, cytochrome b556 subunit, partial [Gammaproteobacteria bacterium]